MNEHTNFMLKPINIFKQFLRILYPTLLFLLCHCNTVESIRNSLPLNARKDVATLSPALHLNNEGIMRTFQGKRPPAQQSSPFSASENTAARVNALLAVSLNISGAIALYSPAQPNQCVDATRFLANQAATQSMKYTIREIFIPFDARQTQIPIGSSTTSHTILEVEWHDERWVIDTQVTQLGQRDRNNVQLPQGFSSQYIYPAKKYYAVVPAFSDSLAISRIKDAFEQSSPLITSLQISDLYPAHITALIEDAI